MYVSEALIPVEIGELSLRFTHASEESNNEVLCAALDLLGGQREMALIQIATQKAKNREILRQEGGPSTFQSGGLCAAKLCSQHPINQTWESLDPIRKDLSYRRDKRQRVIQTRENGLLARQGDLEYGISQKILLLQTTTVLLPSLFTHYKFILFYFY